MAKKRAGRPGLNAGQCARVRAAMRRLKGRHGTQEALAAVLGVTQSAVSQVLGADNRPSFQMACAVAKAEGVEVMALLDGTPKRAKVVRAGAVA